jgi:DNA-binding IclR family transcriptional regulator
VPRSRLQPTLLMRSGTVGTFDRGLRILELFATSASPLTLTDVCDALQIETATTFPYLATLQSLGYLRQNATTKSYYLQSRALSIAASYLERGSFLEYAIPPLAQLHDATGNAVHYGILDGVDVVCLATFNQPEFPNPRRIGARVGAHRSAMGRVLLATLPDSVLRSRVEQIGATEDRKSFSLPHLFDALASIRRQGYALDEFKSDGESRSLAVPVFGVEGAIAAIDLVSLPGPPSVIALLQSYTGPLRCASEAITAAITARRPKAEMT